MQLWEEYALRHGYQGNMNDLAVEIGAEKILEFPSRLISVRNHWVPINNSNFSSFINPIQEALRNSIESDSIQAYSVMNNPLPCIIEQFDYNNDNNELLGFFRPVESNPSLLEIQLSFSRENWRTIIMNLERRLT
jgi:hypothetical protein